MPALSAMPAAAPAPVTAARQPVYFISHGSPMLALQDSDARRFLQTLGRDIRAAGIPRAILMLSAHWETAAPTASLADRPETIHDFGGFPRALFEMRYPAPGAPEVARAALAALAAAGITVTGGEARGLDHGAWVPLILMFPEADIPVAQLSIQPHLGPAHHRRLGEALRPLRDQGVLIIASGSLTHNLRDLAWEGTDEVAPWAAAFQSWIHDKVSGADVAALDDYRARAPFARQNHPRDEHLLPLFAAVGAATPGQPGRRLHGSVQLGALAMDAYRFD
ncbi:MULTISPECIES: DODA-type extradiol aromatic ring-opening family dioxygenase [Nitrospirillum]|uniref:4,5-DOPA dioxygenase extradiol n=1 Tax=Nitrospirillum amazonense TaxID=28077 RepID=A0A560EWA6_9PROT|nr:class III extradiol ring-cleavage dioxygenase [Nitrospirillum amazonense]MEC4594862.1 class III extradiol ring-cleavage dioxygenase [Nitrospirillum amazonense]TWB13659.1 4,5-DOPA dioxygenase extradiol [Nitrospirillum amazonense]